jgi:hypothetical protein
MAQSSSKVKLHRYWLSGRYYALVARVAESLVPDLQALLKDVNAVERSGAIVTNQCNQVVLSFRLTFPFHLAKSFCYCG